MSVRVFASVLETITYNFINYFDLFNHNENIVS